MPRQHAAMPRDDNDDDEGAVDTPLHLIQPFGSGLHRRPVPFVKAGAAAPTSDRLRDALPGPAVSDLYLSIVMGEAAESAATATTATTESPTCDVCRLPLAASASATPSTHASCLVHQVALAHAPPPSALDRRRRGLAMLAAHGWDPDRRRGLGADEQGMVYPLQPKARPERLALGATTANTNKTKTTTVTRTYGAREIRRRDAAQRRRTAQLRAQLLESRDVDKLLYGEMTD